MTLDPVTVLIFTLVVLLGMIAALTYFGHRRWVEEKCKRQILQQKADIADTAMQVFDDFFAIYDFYGFDVTGLVHQITNEGLVIDQDRLPPIPETMFYYALPPTGERVVFFPSSYVEQTFLVVWRTQSRLASNVEGLGNSELLPTAHLKPETAQVTRNEQGLLIVCRALREKLEVILGQRAAQRPQEAQEAPPLPRSIQA